MPTAPWCQERTVFPPFGACREKEGSSEKDEQKEGRLLPGEKKNISKGKVTEQ